MSTARCLVLLVLIAAGCGGSSSTAYPVATETPEVEAPLSPGDTFECRIYYGENEVKATYRLGQSGTVSIQYIGKVKASGKKASDLEEEIRKRLADGYLREPIVSLTLLEAASRRISVFGQVAKAGTIDYVDGMTVVDAIAQAGGFTAMAKKNSVQVTRVLEGKKRTFTLPVESIGEGDRANFQMRAGDVVFVPERLF